MISSPEEFIMTHLMQQLTYFLITPIALALSSLNQVISRSQPKFWSPRNVSVFKANPICDLGLRQARRRMELQEKGGQEDGRL